MIHGEADKRFINVYTCKTVSQGILRDSSAVKMFVYELLRHLQVKLIMAAPISPKSVEAFNTIVHGKGNLILIHFYTPWADQCKQINVVLSELMKDRELQDLLFLMVDAEELPEISEKYNITAVPTCLFIKNEKEIERLNGADAELLSKKAHLLSITHASVSLPKQDLNTRLKTLIEQHPVMLFMKGSPTDPKCGFSKKIIAILKDNSVDFQTFDILTDEVVRQGLKTYSDWPTYPQLYANGELIGGLDIVRELAESGDLRKELKLDESNMNDRLKGLINEAQVMLFMKGSADAPKCGFSRTMVSILNKLGTEFKTFDILKDDKVRQCLKLYSDWPTYPQLYVKGELIGGLDIVQELQESGELEEVLKK